VIDYTCRDVEDLLPGYAANALEEQERCAVSEHLAECRRHDTELTAIRADLERFALSVEPVDPPPGLKESLLRAFDEDVAAPVTTPEQISRRRPERGERSILGGPAFAYAVAAAMLALAIGLGAWGLSRNGSGGAEDVVVAQSSQGGASMQVTYVPSEQVAVMDVELPQLPSGRVYQAWRIDGSTPVSLGVLSTNSGSIAMHADLEGATAIALSVEPTGGSVAPTTNPFLVASLESS
jgi:anti-sigma-K factor RskA